MVIELSRLPTGLRFCGAALGAVSERYTYNETINNILYIPKNNIVVWVYIYMY